VNILILGGTGFIGPFVVRELLSRGHQVAVFHRGKSAADLSASVQHILGERRDLADFAAPFQRFSPDVVLDMFAYFEADALAAVQVTRGLAQRFVCVSSMDVYRAYGQLCGLESGAPDPQPFDEDAPLRSVLYPYRAQSKEPDDFLFRYDKIPVEKVVMSQPDLPGTVLRLPMVFGPGDGQHRLAAYLKSMDTGEDISLDEKQANWRTTRGYVEDVALAIALAVTNKKAAGRIYNVGEKSAQTEREWVEKVGRIAGWRGKIKVAPSDAESESEGWNYDLAANTNRIRDELGFAEGVSPDEALRRTLDWERANLPQLQDNL
jgi:nucleoside-diphosphate-sugar epimerase